MVGCHLVVYGSSPLTRGKRGPGRIPGPPPRLIPAHAGKTMPLTGGSSATGAHPRSRGENGARESLLPAPLGSSPLTRGKLSPRGRSCGRRRLIPAHAGKTRRHITGASSTSAHPRSRGENEPFGRVGLVFAGSSPLTRGKPVTGIVDQAAGRLIPAHAGKTVKQDTRKEHPWAHPRSRGENRAKTFGDIAGEGSSPLTRGKLGAKKLSRKHPGSSPLTRGKRQVG